MSDKKVHTEFWCGNQRERDKLRRPRSKWEDNIKIDSQKVEWAHGLD